jgi:hypothetical protein
MKIFIVFSFLSIAVLCNAQEFRNSKNYPLSSVLFNGLCSKPVKLYYANDYIIDVNVNDTIKNKLIELLDFQWSMDEIDEYLDIQYEISKKALNFDFEADYNSQKNGKKNYLKKVSNYNIQRIAFRNEQLNYLIRDHLTSINPKIIMLLGSLDIKKSIPKLYPLLIDSVQYSKFALELALARMGDAVLQSKILNSSSLEYDIYADDRQWLDFYSLKSRTLIYLNTQQSIFKLSEWLDTSKNYCTLSHGCGNVKPSNQVVYDLYKIIENKDFSDSVSKIVNVKKSFFDWEEKESVAVILFCKNWLINNRGNYVLNRKYFKYKFPVEN